MFSNSCGISVQIIPVFAEAIETGLMFSAVVRVRQDGVTDWI